MAVVIAAQKNNIKGSIRALLNHYKDEIDFRKTIFLKPNIVFPVNDRCGEITRLSTVRSIVEVLREDYGPVNILIGEGTAAGTNALRNFKVSGYQTLANRLNVSLLDLHSVERIPLEWKYGTIYLPKVLFDTTYISLPILKESSAALMSGAMKNQKGLLSTEMKKSFHRLGLHEPIAALCAIIQPHLTIMDGSNFFLNDLLIAGTNLYEVDHLATTLLGIDEPGYLRSARGYFLGGDKYEVVGQKLATRNKRRFGYRKYKKYLNLRLWSNPTACSMCRFSTGKYTALAKR